MNRTDNRVTQLTAEAAAWYRALRDTSNLAFIPLYADRHRYLVLMGGGGSGKSIFAGRKILERAISEPGHRFLVCRKVARTLRESCFRQLLRQLEEHYKGTGYRANQTDMRIAFENGSEIIFTGLDDTEKLKSIYGITGIWIEEASELEERDFNQLDIRLRGKTPRYKQIILSFNPVSALHWLKHRFFDTPDSRTLTHRSTYHDNRFLDSEQAATLEAFRESDPYYYSVYCLGQWGVLGQSVFDAGAVAARLAEDIKPVSTGYFEYRDDGRELHDIRWVEDGMDGFIKIYAPPEDGAPYVIGGDTAGGGSDFFAGQVIDNRTGKQAAVLRRRLDEDVYARQMYCLGMYYNRALVAIEANFSSYPVLELERLGYPNQYVRESVDDFTHAVRNSFGFWTSTKTRPVIVSGLIRALREDLTLVSDASTLEEMLTFVRGEDFRPAAEAGAHDDLVMALAIAHFAREQQRYDSVPASGERVRWTADMWEDYRSAGREGREYLIRKWGAPMQ